MQRQATYGSARPWIDGAALFLTTVLVLIMIFSKSKSGVSVPIHAEPGSQLLQASLAAEKRSDLAVSEDDDDWSKPDDDPPEAGMGKAAKSHALAVPGSAAQRGGDVGAQSSLPKPGVGGSAAAAEESGDGATAASDGDDVVPEGGAEAAAEAEAEGGAGPGQATSPSSGGAAEVGGDEAEMDDDEPSTAAGPAVGPAAAAAAAAAAGSAALTSTGAAPSIALVVPAESATAPNHAAALPLQVAASPAALPLQIAAVPVQTAASPLQTGIAPAQAAALSAQAAATPAQAATSALLHVDPVPADPVGAFSRQPLATTQAAPVAAPADGLTREQSTSPAAEADSSHAQALTSGAALLAHTSAHVAATAAAAPAAGTGKVGVTAMGPASATAPGSGSSSAHRVVQDTVPQAAASLAQTAAATAGGASQLTEAGHSCSCQPQVADLQAMVEVRQEELKQHLQQRGDRPEGSTAKSLHADIASLQAEAAQLQGAATCRCPQPPQAGQRWQSHAELNDMIEAAAAADIHQGGWHADAGAAETGNRASAGAATALVAVPTANVYDKTLLLLLSLASSHDRFEVLVVDELSTDETGPELARHGVHVLQPDAPRGLTHNWNLAWRFFRASAHQHLFIINNDVLVPPGALDKLVAAMDPAGGNCDVVAPLSTAKGKGTWGNSEGIEAVYHLSPLAARFCQNPLNYARVQALLDATAVPPQDLVLDSAALHNKGFSGFFFGLRRTVERAQFDAENLFDPALRNIGQEQDLFKRMAAQKTFKICMHSGTFVYHFKGSTIPSEMLDKRQKWVRPDLRSTAPDPGPQGAAKPAAGTNASKTGGEATQTIAIAKAPAAALSNAAAASS